MFDNYKIKKASDIKYHDLGKITSEFFGKSNLEEFLNKYSSEEVSMKLGKCNRYTKEYWLNEYEKGNIFVLRDSTFARALTLTKNGYKLNDSNNLFFDNSLNYLIKTLRPPTAIPIYKKVINEETIEKVYEPIAPTTKTEKEKGLTVFLGGAGMRGNYQYDFIKALKDAGISNVVRGNYSAFLYGVDENYIDDIDMAADGSAVVFYNQDTNDPIALQLVDTRGCKVGKELEFLNLKYVSYKGRTIKDKECQNTYKFELKIPSNVEFNLKTIQVQEKIPEKGQFNFIGYSWGSVVASRTALEYARKGTKIHNLVLIGSPINYSLLQALQKNSNIENVIIINLTEFGDPIYAGMTDKEILSSVLKLIPQMTKGTGHFHYSVESNDGRVRRIKLAKELYSKGLR